MSKKLLFAVAMLLLAAFALTACAGEAGPPGPEGPQGPQGEQGEQGAPPTAADLTCTECHNETAVVSAKVAAQGVHPHTAGSGWSYAGGRDGCTGCHSGASFPAMVESGVIPDDSTVVDVTPIDCRACHQVHTTYTAADWALTVEADATDLYAFEGATFEGGAGNLCASCHQPRRPIDEADADGNIAITSTHWGPHHGPQSAVMLGVGGAGPEGEGKPASHYNMVENTCVSCHLGENSAHTFAPTVAACQGCHADIEDLDFSGFMAETEASLAELEGLLEFQGAVAGGGPNPGTFPAPVAQAAWNWIMLSYEDNSSGVHNPAYVTSLLEWSIEAAQPSAESVELCAALSAGDACVLVEATDDAEAVEGVCTAIAEVVACGAIPPAEAPAH